MKSSKKLISLIMAMAMLASAGMSFGASAEAVDNSQASAIAQSIQDNGGAYLEQEDGTIVPVDVEVSVKELGSSYTRSGEVAPRYAVTMTAYALKDENRPQTRSSKTDGDSQYGCYGTLTAVYSLAFAGQTLEQLYGGWYGSAYAFIVAPRQVSVNIGGGMAGGSQTVNYSPDSNTFSYNVNRSGYMSVSSQCAVYMSDSGQYSTLHCFISL